LHAGPRGSQAEHFAAKQKKRKWLEYDQMLFRRIHRDLSLLEYLRPGLALEGHRRTALLQRAVIMANKNLFAEALADLAEVSAGADQSPLCRDEVALVQEGLAGRSFYGGGIRSDPSTLAALGRLSKQSRVTKEICAHLRTVVLRDLRRVGRALLHEISRGRVERARGQVRHARRLTVQLSHVK
jgi:hypothetical protein